MGESPQPRSSRVARRRQPIVRINSGPTPAMPPFSAPYGPRRRSTRTATPHPQPTPHLQRRPPTPPHAPQLKSVCNFPSISGTKNVPTSTNLPFGMPTNLTVHGYVDTQLEETIPVLRQQNVGIVIREESEMLRILKESNKRKTEASYTGKGKGKQNQSPYMSTPPPVSKKRKIEASYTGKGKGKENHCPYMSTPPPTNWDDMVAEFNRMNNTDRRGWGIHNRIFVRTGLRWPGYLDIETSTFCRVMLRMLMETKCSRR